MKLRILIFVFSLLSLSEVCNSQALKAVRVSTSENKGLQIVNFNGFQQPGYDLPLISVRINGECCSSLNARPADNEKAVLKGKLALSADNIKPLRTGGIVLQLSIRNISSDTITVSNIVPFGESNRHVYLTSWDKGDPLSRAFIFRPGYSPANVTLPDNSWGIGLGIVDVDNGSSVVSLSKIDKQASERISARRFETIMYPGANLVYSIWMDSYIGRWQEGLRLMFQKNMLFDVEPGTFDNTLYEREDLKWVRHGYVGHFVSAWHNYFYNNQTNAYTFDDFSHKTQQLYGGDDYMILWTGFPVLGLDQRNQWDLVRSLPGGVKKLKAISDEGLKHGMHLMSNYTPWDLPASQDQIFNSTRYENPIDGLGRISQEVGFWGTMFDTRSESGKWFQNGIDRYRKGFAIFPEGMCVPADMQNCVIGRTHAAIEYAPFLNLNRLIKPDFCIYRQAVIEKDNPRRDAALSFFNGHGVEYHLYMPLSLDWLQELYEFTGRTVRILRENTDNFSEPGWIPLIPTTTDSIWVNEWPGVNKTIYTIYSLKPEGYNDYLFEVPADTGWHYIDLWHHKELTPKRAGSKFLIKANLDPFPKKYLGTRSEANVEAIARFRSWLLIEKKGINISIQSPKGKELKIWHGSPKYDKQPVFVSNTDKSILISEVKLRENGFKGDLVIQLFDGKQLIDERVLQGTLSAGKEVPIEYFSLSKGLTSYSGKGMEAQLLREQDLLTVKMKDADEIVISLKDRKNFKPIILREPSKTFRTLETFDRYEGDFVIIARKNNVVVDSTNLNMPYGYPRLASKEETTDLAKSASQEMVYVPGGKFRFIAKHIGDWMIKYPVEDTAKVFSVKSFYMDKHPVTNVQYKQFMEATHYQPKDTENFLKHWENGKIAPGEENNPVTFVSYEDAKAYAKWVGKRLPTEKEWQYAAQGEDGRLYPWGDKMDSLKCNTGNGRLDCIGKYPQGANQLGIEELTGSVWQMTNDLYSNTCVDFIILKGGSYFTPRSSWWYVTGGALPLTFRQQWLRVSQGYERNATVGFRLVKDAN
ncbi:formylglycine-generating enzyme family protein [Bacteroides sedimenti]|uniref:Sulfatase-modifying factor enzyme-like domain-containing protein n=1 Tax=Bacteroides sedimenti TaxID=2136147 RepID=A0ABN6Z6Q1_9BACE